MRASTVLPTPGHVLDQQVAAREGGHHGHRDRRPGRRAGPAARLAWRARASVPASARAPAVRSEVGPQQGRALGHRGRPGHRGRRPTASSEVDPRELGDGAVRPGARASSHRRPGGPRGRRRQPGGLDARPGGRRRPRRPRPRQVPVAMPGQVTRPRAWWPRARPTPRPAGRWRRPAPGRTPGWPTCPRRPAGVGTAEAAVGLGRLEQVGAPVGDPLEHRPHELGPAGAAGDPEQGAAGAEVPHRRAQAEQRRDEPDVAGAVAAARRRRPTPRRGSISPRSSRSHSTQVPADSIMASTPQVGRPARCQATIGKVPAGAAAAAGRATRPPVHRSSMPPGPEGRLGQPGPGAALADQRGLLVAGDAADGRGAREGRGLARRRRTESTIVAAAWPAGMRRRSSTRSSQSQRCPVRRPARSPRRWWRRSRAGRTRRRPPASVQATQVSTVPKQSSLGRPRRSGSTSSRMAASLVADALGASRKPSACRVRQVPTVRRSCQPMAGATGRPVARSHTTVVARWLAMPTPPTGPPSARAAAGQLERRRRR